jgi:hypothetical protein
LIVTKLIANLIALTRIWLLSQPWLVINTNYPKY